MKRTLGILLVATMMMTFIAGCSTGTDGTNPTTAPTVAPTANENAVEFDTSKEISVASREEGSGTRGAFIELFGIEQKDANGEKVDYTTEEASITNNTSVMMTTVAGNLYSIGYISLGSLNDSVKALKIDGAEATAENIKNNTYKIARPFNIATKGTVSEVAQDFIDFIMSADGQKIVEENGYIKVSENAAYSGSKPTGKIVAAGSSSVTPVMEKLKEAYLAINPNATIEVQLSDSTTGMTSAIDGICDIGMASREVKDSELEAGLSALVIAKDGIAVIINNDNPMDELTKDQVKSIFTGETLEWSEIAE